MTMDDDRPELAPGDEAAPSVIGEETFSGLRAYVIGLVLAVILTATSFWAANTSLLWAPGVTTGLAVLAVAQMGVHLVFFLHIQPQRQHDVARPTDGFAVAALMMLTGEQGRYLKWYPRFVSAEVDPCVTKHDLIRERPASAPCPR
jgi:cytochrome o ubiquinol oxidase subunit IV